MAVVELPPAVRVSPFIRFCRYGALTSGFVYGVLRYKYLKRKEAKIKVYEDKQKEIIHAKKAAEAKVAERDQLIYLAKECGISVPPTF